MLSSGKGQPCIKEIKNSSFVVCDKHGEVSTGQPVGYRKTFRTLKDSCFAELKWAIHRLELDDYWEIKESPLEMTYKPTD